MALTIDELAAALGVMRRTLERTIAAKRIVPTSRTPSGRARFDESYAEQLKGQARVSRAKGYLTVVPDIGTDTPRTSKGPQPLTTAQFIRTATLEAQ